MESWVLAIHFRQEQDMKIENIWRNGLLIGFLAGLVPGLCLFFGFQNDSRTSILIGIGGIPGGLIGSAIGKAIGKQNVVIVWIGAVVGAFLGSSLWFLMLGGAVA